MKRSLIGVAATAGVAASARLATHRWGATTEEHAMSLPGDELVPEPAIVATRAVNIEASPNECGLGWCRSAKTVGACTATTGSRTS